MVSIGARSGDVPSQNIIPYQSAIPACVPLDTAILTNALRYVTYYACNFDRRGLLCVTYVLREHGQKFI